MTSTSSLAHSRREFLRVLAVAIATATGGMNLTACSKKEPLLRIATNVWPGYELLYLAAERQYFSADVARMVAVPSATACLQALASGNVEAATLTLDEVLSARADNMPLVVVAMLDTSLGADVLLAKSNITSLAGLAGKRIGVEKSAVGAVMLDAALKNGGLTTADVQLVYATVDEHEALFNTNKVDALVTFEPIPKLLESKGAVRLFDSADIPGRIIDTLAVREDVLVKNPRALRTVIAGHFKALDELRREPARASAFISQRLGIAPEQVPAAYTGLDLPDASTNLVWMTGKPAKLQVSAETLQDIMLQARLLPRKATLDNLIDAQFLPGAAP